MPAFLMILRRLVQRRRSRSDRVRSKAGSALQALTAIELLSAVRPSRGRRGRRGRRLPVALALGGAIAAAVAVLGKRRRAQSSLGAPDAGLDIDAPNTGADTAATAAAEPAPAETGDASSGEARDGEPAKPHGDPVAEEAKAAKG